MDISLLKTFLLWCTVINYGVLLVWFGAFTLARGALFRLHTRWFQLAPEWFATVHYAGMAIYKIGILLFNLVPLVAVLCMATR
jgi:hypothetical protein